MSNNGYIPISRRIFEHRFWCEDREYSRFEAWLDLLQSARFENATQYIGKYRQQRLKRGQQVAAVRYLAERWGWGKKRVELFLNYLMDEGMIAKETSKETGITIITIIKYDTYNRSLSVEETQEDTAGRHEGDTRETNINKVNKGNTTTLTGSDSCESTECKRQKGGDCKGGGEKTTWKQDFQVYLSELREAYKTLTSDAEWTEQQQRLNPGVDVPKTLEKACLNYWATEAGWSARKGKKIQSINWKQTLANAISQPMNRVYHERTRNTTIGLNAQREAEKRDSRAEMESFATAILSGTPGTYGK